HLSTFAAVGAVCHADGDSARVAGSRRKDADASLRVIALLPLEVIDAQLAKSSLSNQRPNAGFDGLDNPDKRSLDTWQAQEIFICTDHYSRIPADELDNPAFQVVRGTFFPGHEIQ